MVIAKGKIFINIFKVFALLALILTVSVMIPGRPAQAATKNKSLSMNKTYKSYDITNNGKKDKIRLTPVGSSHSYYSGLKIKVNGKTAYNLKGIYVYSFSAKLMTLSNKKSFLWVRGYGDNDDGPNLILRYDQSSGKLKAVADFENIFRKYGSHIYTNIKKVSGKQVVVNVQMCSYALAGISFDMTFTYKSGTLNYANKMTSCKLLYGPKNNTLRANRNLTAYATKKLSGKKYTIKKNKTVKIKCFYLNGSKFEYKMDVNGKTRWKKFKTSFPSKHLFKNLNYYG